MNDAGRIDFAGLLATLGFAESEYVSICHKPPGGLFLTEVCCLQDAPTTATADIYFGVCPTSGPARKNAGRGKAADITRLSALWVDLDIAPGKCPTREIADALIGDLSEILTARPAAITETGHGLHPYWPVQDGVLDVTFTRDSADRILRQWKSVVNATAQRREAKVDSVFDLARVLRVPGSYNNKKEPQ